MDYYNNNKNAQPKTKNTDFDLTLAFHNGLMYIVRVASWVSLWTRTTNRRTPKMTAGKEKKKWL